MRLSNEARYPHPVLGSMTNDYKNYEENHFKVTFSAGKKIKNGALELSYAVSLKEPNLYELVTNGEAKIGCIVVCQDTYYNRLHSLSLDRGILDFSAGKLIGKVTLRPVVWIAKNGTSLKSEHIDAEFGENKIVNTGDIVAIDSISSLFVGQANLASMESIFALAIDEEMSDGLISVSLDSPHIVISLSRETFKVVTTIREMEINKVLMSSIYLPAVMEVIEQIRSPQSTYESYRWYRTFKAKCEILGVSLDENTPLLETAQKLLNFPVAGLNEVMHKAG